MRTSIWFRTEEKQPDKSGYYFTYRGWGMGGKADGDQDYGYLYYRKKDNSWYEYEGSWNSMFPDVVSFVYYWTDADPKGWTDEDPPSVSIRGPVKSPIPAVQAAWEEAMKAIANYELVKNLAQ